MRIRPQHATLALLTTKSSAERRLFVRSAMLFICAHILIRIGNLESSRTRLAGIARRLRVASPGAAALATTISSVNRHLPGRHSCLIQALCCEAIARNSGIPVEFKLGAARAEPGMRFHAWVEHQGDIIAGHHDGEFTPFS